MDTPVLADQQKLTFISSVQTLNAVLQIYQEQWTIGMDFERGSKESMLSAHFDVDEANLLTITLLKDVLMYHQWLPESFPSNYSWHYNELSKSNGTHLSWIPILQEKIIYKKVKQN